MSVLVSPSRLNRRLSDLSPPQCEIVLETRDARLVRRRPRRRSSSTCCSDDGGDAIVPNQGDFTFEGLTN